MQISLPGLSLAAGFFSLLFLLSSCKDGLDLDSIEVGSDNTVSWEDAVKIITLGKVETVSQKHNLEVSITMANGTRYRTTEPKIDEVIQVIERVGKRDEIAIMTE